MDDEETYREPVRSFRALALALTSAVLLAGASSATAEPGLTPVAAITPVTAAAYDPDVSVGADGTAYAV